MVAILSVSRREKIHPDAGRIPFRELLGGDGIEIEAVREFPVMFPQVVEECNWLDAGAAEADGPVFDKEAECGVRREEAGHAVEDFEFPALHVEFEKIEAASGEHGVEGQDFDLQRAGMWVAGKVRLAAIEAGPRESEFSGRGAEGAVVHLDVGGSSAFEICAQAREKMGIRLECKHAALWADESREHSV